ncbi:MAG TPA: AAA family ATPase, partial [Ferruginibacter sp.]|nr:AAA family ATPase [Ferruginibacter sp.]
MIKKFVKISGTGKFLNYNHSTPLISFRTTDFEKINLIYGENGSGKTTLSVILKSLKGNNALLSRKRSFDTTFPQTIEVLTNSTVNSLHTFANGTWNNHKSDIEIFDIHFINENIYTGLEIQNTHKKNLFEIIFGQQGIQLKIDIKNLKEIIEETNKEIRETTEKIKLAIDNAYTATDYCNILIDEAIDDKIIAKDAEIVTARNYQTIKQKLSLALIPVLTLPFEFTTVIAALSKSIDTISETYLQKFREHKEHLAMDGKEEEWLKQGYNSVVNNSCPFCLRTLDSIEIFEAYKQYFNDEYNLLLKVLSDLNASFSAFNLDSSLLQIESVITKNSGLIDFWKIHLPNPPQLTSIIEHKEKLVDAFLKVKVCLETKSRNPIHAIELADINSFELLVSTFNTQINEFNVLITDYNQRVATLKASSQPNIVQLEVDLKKLKAIKKRGDTLSISLCTKLTADSLTVATLKTQKDAKQRELDTYSATIFTLYSTKINEYLQKFASYLEIRNLNSGYVGSSKEPMIQYALHINGTEIRQEDNPLFPSFKYSLSEGDKSALALAFFLTKLEVDGNIQSKVILFDDPVSSFDLNRKATTIN